MRKKTSIIWRLNKEKLEEIVKNNYYWSDVLKLLDISLSGAVYRMLKQRLLQDGIDFSHINNSEKINIKVKKHIPLEEILTEKSAYSRRHLKKRLIDNGILENKCCECGITNIWNNKPISLQLDHINGIRDDNRIENLRFLCPNCHSQTENYSGKHKLKKKNINVDKKVLIEILNQNTIKESAKILRTSEYVLRNEIKNNNIVYNKKLFKDKPHKRKFEIAKDDLEKLIKEKSFEEIGRMYGVNGNSIRKRCKKYGIETKIYGRGYWAKKKAGEDRIVPDTPHNKTEA